ncbi:hypothetical protein HK101_007809, partial [Irineochytrium annulatum]
MGWNVTPIAGPKQGKTPAKKRKEPFDALDEVIPTRCLESGRKAKKPKPSGRPKPEVKPTRGLSADAEGKSLPMNKLGWQRVSAPFVVGDWNDAPSGFLALEEVEGVDVETSYDANGGKMIKFRRVKPLSSKGKAVKEQDLDVVEEMGEFIHVDDYNSDLEAPPATKAADTKAPATAPIKASTKASATKPPNKRERQQMKRSAKEVVGTSKKTTEGASPKGAPEESIAEDSDAEEPYVDTSAVRFFEKDMLAEMEAWSPFRLSKSILLALKELGYTTPTAIQSSSLRAALITTRKGNGKSSGRDMIGAASTGSGKTLAFGLPILQDIALSGGKNKAEGCKNVRMKPCVALVLTPTRELALQITEHLKAVAKNMKATIVPLVGGISLDKQRRLISYSPDIVVATPGRLWEILGENNAFRYSLKCCRYLVLDEADRLLESGHFKDLENILNVINLEKSEQEEDGPEEPVADMDFKPPEKRQTFIFSATLLPTSEHLMTKKLHKAQKGPPRTLLGLLQRIPFSDPEPVRLNLTTDNVVATGITETRMDCLKEDKDATLYYLLKSCEGRSVVFLNSIDAVRRLVSVLKVLQLNAIPLHAEIQQRQRMKNVERFRGAADGILLASDVAARGLDFTGVKMVVHFQVPRSADIYVHRSGRTARGVSTGISVLLCAPEEVTLYRRICHSLGKAGGLPEYAVDPSVLHGVKKRVALAKKIEAEEHKAEKRVHEREWFEKAAEEAGVLVDEDYIPAGGRGVSDKLRKMKEEFARLMR